MNLLYFRNLEKSNPVVPQQKVKESKSYFKNPGMKQLKDPVVILSERQFQGKHPEDCRKGQGSSSSSKYSPIEQL